VKVWNIKDEESAITLDNHEEKVGDIMPVLITRLTWFTDMGFSNQ